MSSSAKAVKVTKKESEKYRRSLVEKKEAISQEMLKNKDAGQENAEEITQDIADKASSSYTKEFLFRRFRTGSGSSCRRSIRRSRASRKATTGCAPTAAASFPRSVSEAVPWTPYCVDCMELAEKGAVGLISVRPGADDTSRRCGRGPSALALDRTPRYAGGRRGRPASRLARVSPRHGNSPPSLRFGLLNVVPETHRAIIGVR